MATVLIAEDDKDIVELLRLYISGSGYDVLASNDGEQALELAREQHVDIALVDIMMPRMNGYDFIKALRRESGIPVIIISARSQPADKIVGLDAGADGFIPKPFDPLEVTALIRAMLRRANGTNAPESDNSSASIVELPSAQRTVPMQQEPADALIAGDLIFDKARFLLTKRGETVPLTAAELKIMAALMAAPGRVFDKAQLYAQISGEPFGGESSVMVHISNIRAKLEDDPLHPRYIETVRGIGYRFNG
ncbi:response regulator transcription factor [uncultured Enorma sp.]|jgi:DNA-binding response OmpR family regulator|uniref:response regulator transcription factor n=1 Tax=uncultured Enorma sp. TaxID=1714346 RepID=UPI0025F9E5AF|nr:response regulator transcription factor [uncultured Enorma sp.]